MTRKNHIIAFAVLVVLAMALYPPWVQTYTRQGMTPSQRPAGYAALWDPPEMPGSRLVGLRLDIARLGVQIIAVAAGTALLILITDRRRTRAGEPESATDSDREV